MCDGGVARADKRCTERYSVDSQNVHVEIYFERNIYVGFPIMNGKPRRRVV